MIQNKKRAKQIAISYLLVILVFFLTSSIASASLDDLKTTLLTSLPKEIHEAPSIALYENTVHVVWNTRHTENSSQIYYKRSLNNGNSWDNTTKLSSNTINALYPVVAVYIKTIHVVWVDYRHEKSELYYIRSIDNGETWDSSKRLTFVTDIVQASTRESYFYDVSIAVDRNIVYLVWKDYRSGSSEIFFKKSIDNGDTWEDEQDLNLEIAPSYAPAFAVKDSNIFIVYESWGNRANIRLLKSSDNGDTWMDKKYLTESETEGGSEKPDIAIMNDNIYLVWQDDRTGYSEIYIKKSLNGGESWGGLQQLTFNSSLIINPKIYVYDDMVTVIWQDLRNDTFDMCYKTSSDSGETWGESNKLVEIHDCYDVEIVGEADNIHIIWQAYHGAGWADIWHLSDHGQRPIITVLMVSQTTFNLPGSIDITVDGEDAVFPKSELICNIQYLSPSDEWKDLDVTFNNNYWEALLLLDKNSKTGNYNIRANLGNLDGNKSDWKLITDVLVSEKEPSLETPGFEFIFFILVIFIMIIVIKIDYWKKKRK